MHTKGNFINRIEPVFFEMKSMGVFVWVPLAVCWLCLPVGFLLYEHAPLHAQQVRDFVMEQSDGTLPILSVWWLYFAMREYIEGDGRELLFVKSSRGVQKSKCAGCFLYYVLYMLQLFPAMLIYRRWTGAVWDWYGKYAVICFFYCGMGYLLLFSLRSVPISLLIQLLFTLLCNTNSILTLEKFNYARICFRNRVQDEALLLAYGIVGMAAWVVGYFFNRLERKY